VHYPWHPGYGTALQVVYREQRRGEQLAVCRVADGTCAVVPAWMLDAGACAGMRLGEAHVSISTLIELASLLAAIAGKRPSTPPTEAQEEHHEEVADATPAVIEPRPIPARRPRRPRAPRGCARAGKIAPGGKRQGSAGRGKGGRRWAALSSPRASSNAERSSTCASPPAPRCRTDNLESQRRQYALADLARSYGFKDVVTIDDDLGRSASGSAARPGFESLVAQLCQGGVGAAVSLEASRLARNGRD